MLPELGLICIITAFCLNLLQILVFATPMRRLPIMRPIAIGQTFFICISFLILAHAFLTNDFTVNFVAQNSNSSLPIFYKITAIWAAHEGSLLLWIFMLSIWLLLIAQKSSNWPLKFTNAIFLTYSLTLLGFCAILLFASNPFARTLTNIPIDGHDLNPLLQDFGMILHPPILYLGYVGSAVGFAFAIAGVINGKLDESWAQQLRPWVLLTWAFLTLGIALGSWWAYYELGWGGWWFWDPVENASFMPWLTSTALLHTLSASRKHGQLLWLAVFLCIITFALSLFGTFLVRSGAIISVHAFASDPLRGSLFLMFLCSVIVAVIWLLYTRIKHVEIPEANNTQLQRLSLFMFANCTLLMIATATILLGTLYPLLSEKLFGIVITVGYPYFNMVFIPIMLLLFLLMVPYFGGLKIVWRTMFLTTLATLSLYLYFGSIKYGALLGISTSLLIILSSLQHKNLTMNLAHIGLAITILGISITPSYEIERDVSLAIGDKVQIANFAVQFNKLSHVDGANYVGFSGEFIVSKHEKILAQLHPEKRTYLFPETTMTETAIYPGLLQDIYIALGQKLNNDLWAVRIYYKPFVRWIWLGALVMALAAFYGVCQKIIQKLYRKLLTNYCKPN